jgi:hypothetical protein
LYKDTYKSMDNNEHRTDAEMYDVSTYTDQELYNLLDMNSPTDHELEARIIFLIRKYTNMQNESGDELAQFFTNIHKRFFDVSDDSEYEDDEPTTIPFKESKLANTIEHFKSKTTETTSTIEGMTSSTDVNSLPIQNSVPLASQTNTTANTNIISGTSSSVGYTKTLDFATGNLNPLLNQTIKRIISVDSQYRDNKKTLTSDFTFHLSEPLKDVVSMKLYSVQIPYTWWTISTGYGSNLIYLKGNSPGIDNGSYDYPITIIPGNYSPSELAGNINASISNLAATYTDVSFGTTSMNYRPGNSINTFVVDITKQYNETSYDISFSALSTSPFDSIANRDNSGVSIAEFLGFANSRYSLYKLNSSLLPNTATTITSDTNNVVYPLTALNNYFTVYKYIGPQENTSLTTGIDISFTITLSIKTGQSYSRSTLLADLSAQIFASQKLDSNYSYIKRLDISNTTLDPSMVGYKTSSIFQLALKTNRYTTMNTTYSKLIVVFPTETGGNPIWVGPNSCFGFSSTSGEINTLLSDTSPVGSSTTSYNIKSQPKIQLSCITRGFDVSGNGYTITLAPTPNMTLATYINVVNAALRTPKNTNTGEIITNNELNSSFTLATLDNSSNFNLQIDINKDISQNNFVVDLSNFGFQFMTQAQKDSTSRLRLLDLSITNVFDISFQYLNPYNFKDTNPLLVVYSSSGSLHVKDISYSIPNPPVGTVSNNLAQLANILQTQINNYQDSTGSTIFSGSTVTVDTIDNNVATARVSLVINRYLSQNDYSIQFLDYNANGNVIASKSLDPSNSWYNYLFIDPSMIDQSYNLYNNTNKSSISGNVISSSQQGTSYISINGYKPITQNTITLTSSNNYFDLIPTEPGLVTGTILSQITNQTTQYYNTIRISIPYQDNNNRAISYTRDNLLLALNNAFMGTDASGSQISVITKDGSEFTKIRITVNKTFTAADYKVVFYDTVSFVYCKPGSTASSVINSTWDTTLGWVLGFRIATTYLLVPEQVGYKGPISIVGDTGVSTNLFNYFMICLDDYNQNHLNDGLVTVTPRDTSIPLPTYANLSNFVCDPVTGQKVYNTAAVTDDKQLTQAQIYSLTQIANSKLSYSTTNALSRFVSTKSFGQGPFVSDVFAIVPMKVAGLANGSNYVEFSGSLQNQQRTYFGPVNIVKMSVKLVNDRGDIVDLNNANWSFSIIVEMLYQQKPGASNK